MAVLEVYTQSIDNKITGVVPGDNRRQEFSVSAQTSDFQNNLILEAILMDEDGPTLRPFLLDPSKTYKITIEEEV